MYKSGSTKLVKNLNKHHILNLVRLNPGIIARTISNETGLQMSTVIYMLKALEADGLIENLGLGNTTYQGGKPPATWGISGSYGIVIGLEISSKEIRIVALDFLGNLLSQDINPLEFSTSHLVIVHQVTKIIETFIQANKITKNKILGIGVGVPGSVDNDKGIINYSHSFDFHGVRIKSQLEKKLNYKFEIDNDANAGAMGIKWLHKEFITLQNILYMSINQKFSGAGVGFIVNNQVYRGGNGAAGEIPSLFNDTALMRLFKKAYKKDTKNKIINRVLKNQNEYNLSEIVRAAGEGNNACAFIIRELGKEISKHLIQLTNLFDPDTIVIGGDICDAGEIIYPVIKERLRHGVVSEITRDVPVHFSQYKQFSGAVGAAALVFDRIFNDV